MIAKEMHVYSLWFYLGDAEWNDTTEELVSDCIGGLV